MKRPARLPAILLYLTTAAMSVAGTGCLFDSNDRCGTAMKYDEATEACVCDDNAIAVTGGCQACPAGEVAANNQCVASTALGHATVCEGDCP